MNKKELVLFIAKIALKCQKNHIHRLNTIQTLADADKQPIKFLTSKGKYYYYLFSIANVDLKYEDNGTTWTVELI